MRWLVAGTVAYIAGFFLFYPSTLTVRDEANYLVSALAFSRGSPCLVVTDPVSEEVSCQVVGKYLPGTSALMAPFVALAGWRGGYLPGLLALLGALWVTAHWLRGAGRSPLFALLVLGYPPALVFGRVAMSDIPSAGLVALGLWLFWTGDSPRPARRLASGFLAGASYIVRETNPLLFAPFFFGALLRRERSVWALVVGGLIGMALRPFSTWLVFGDPFYVFPFAHEFGPRSILATLPIHSLALLVFVPAGLVGGLLYRGDRRPEAVAAVSLFVLLYLTAGYDGASSGRVRGVLLASRYYLPLVPLLAFLCGESLPRLVRSLAPGPLLLASRAWMTGVVLLAFVIHPAFAWWGDQQRAIRETIYEKTEDGSVVTFDALSTSKFVNPLFGERLLIVLRLLEEEKVTALLQRHGHFFVALLDRSDSAFWRSHARENQALVDRIAARSRMRSLHDEAAGPAQRLRIWRVEPH